MYSLFFYITPLIGFILTLIIMPYLIRYMNSINKNGPDVFKIDSPIIPESGGIGFMIIFIFLLIIGTIESPTIVVQQRLLMTTIIITLVTIIGLIDDFKGLSAKIKPLLLIIIALPILIFQIGTPKPVLPLIGPTQLTIFYWFLALFVIAIPANASNMLDVMNGVMSGSGIMILLTAFITSFIIPIDGRIITDDSIYYLRFVSLTMISVLTAFWLFNRYPAKIFAGDTGSLGVGATIGLVAIFGQIEFVMVVALLLHIMNSFSIISSLKGLRERKEIHDRPVSVKDGIITASKNPAAPITLVRLLVASSSKTEKTVIKQIYSLVAYCCILAILTAFLIRQELIQS